MRTIVGKGAAGLGYARRMSLARRRPTLLLLLWLVLAWLPLRGVAQVVMHLPAPASSAPCHGDHAVTPDADAHAPATQGTPACTLCDLCHGAVLPAAVPVVLAEGAAPQVALAVPLSGHVLPGRLDRPPRG